MKRESPYILPSSSLVPFFAYKLRYPKLIWKNRECSFLANPMKIAFALPHSDDEAGHFSTERLEFVTDRYGGKGVGFNGGGGRTGSIGSVQIKGIGRTPLVGRSTDKIHSHGGANVNEALREAIWGEIYDQLLPYGAIRVAAIVGTNTNTYSLDNHHKRSKRALIMREIPIRPAHFMRANYFDNGDERLSGPGIDATRTKSAIKTFAKALHTYSPDIYAPVEIEEKCVEIINFALPRFLGRIAHQIAVARTKRIPHGTINCSNVCIDGRFLDYGTASAVGDYRRYALTPGGVDFFSEEECITPTIRDLHYYLSRYLDQLGGKKLISVDKLLEKYYEDFDNFTLLEFSKMSGFPEKTIVKIDRKLVDDYATAVIEMISSKCGEIIPLSAAVHSGTAVKILEDLALSADEAQAELMLLDYLDNESMRCRLIRSYFSFRGACISAEPLIKPSEQLVRAALNAIRQLSPCPNLHRDKLKGDIEILISSTNSSAVFSRFIENTVNSIVHRRKDSDHSEVRLDFVFDRPVVYNFNAFHFSDGEVVGLSENFNRLKISKHFSAHISKLITLFNSVI